LPPLNPHKIARKNCVQESHTIATRKKTNTPDFFPRPFRREGASRLHPQQNKALRQMTARSCAEVAMHSRELKIDQ